MSEVETWCCQTYRFLLESLGHLATLWNTRLVGRQPRLSPIVDEPKFQTGDMLAPNNRQGQPWTGGIRRMPQTETDGLERLAENGPLLCKNQ
ncbi:hypothetical protein GWI33_004086 [Rhynchophorus ferrugineus]|uniref:Uncharacterized protein n=1 Tax=Rhynchophorus ferrugineus TaxID=354439 RepID=A0A834IJ74_RHYFE|nr:hypothetical protein GWI33_004086 [Rhynchophorus ferrugineus]